MCVACFLNSREQSFGVHNNGTYNHNNIGGEVKRSAVLIFSLAMLLCSTVPSFAVTFTDIQDLDVTITEGTVLSSIFDSNSYTYKHLTPADFEVPYDIVNSAGLTISGYWIDGDNDYVSISGTVYGHLESGGEYGLDWSWNSWSWVFDDTPSESTISITGAFSTWSTGSPLEVTITANGELGDCIIELSSSRFTLDYDNDTAPTNPVPEPATMLLMGTGLVGMVVVSRRKRFYKKG